MSGEADFQRWQDIFKDNILNSIETMLPAKVIAYDYNTKTASIQILSKTFDIDGSDRVIAPLHNIKVKSNFSGGWCINHPLKVGDTGRLCIYSKDVDAIKTNGGFQAPNNFMQFNYSNSHFIADTQSSNAIMPTGSSTDFFICDETGNIKFSMKPLGEIKLSNSLASISIDQSGTITASNSTCSIIIDNAGNINIVAPTLITVTCPLTLFVGNVAATGTIVSNVPPP
jgi:hypothetical protein